MKKNLLSALMAGVVGLSFTGCGLEMVKDDGPEDQLVTEVPSSDVANEAEDEEDESEEEPVFETVIDEYTPSEEFLQAFEEGKSVGADYSPKDSSKNFTDWKDGYTSLIHDAGEGEYALIYVDENDIPELLYSLNEGSFSIATFEDGAINIWAGKGNEVSLIEKGNAVLISGDNGAGYFDEVVAIKDGAWISVAEGIAEPEDIWTEDSFDENGNPIISIWKLNGNELSSQKEYDEFIAKYFDDKYGTKIEKYISVEEIIDKIEALQED